jgi:uncharacterized protein (DUF1499 family)
MDQETTSKWALASIGFGIVAVAVLLLSGYGYQWGLWGLGTAFTWLLPGSGVVALIGFSLAVIFGFVRWNSPELSGSNIAMLGVVLSLGVIGTIGYWFNEAQQYPPIHDITTNIENPPTFEAVVPLRADAPNDTTYGDQDKAQTQREAYPDLKTLYLDLGYDEAFDRAHNAAEQMAWEEIVNVDKQSGRIEAYDKLPWFGFVDDVVIRVDSANTNGRIALDVRSVSRIGRGDIGVNAHRIREYLEVVRNQ